jgi:hypothetical protein
MQGRVLDAKMQGQKRKWSRDGGEDERLDGVAEGMSRSLSRWRAFLSNFPALKYFGR